jgi:heterotetrameric sarcosine oxidase gamma subunit
VFAPEPRSDAGRSAGGVKLLRCPLDVVELSAYEGRGDELARLAAAHGASLPPFGRSAVDQGRLTLSVRPGRWLLLTVAAAPGAAAHAWQSLSGGQAAVVDLSSALEAFVLVGTAARTVLTRGCRLDLDPEVFRPGHAAATIMAQVSVILAALPAGVLLLSPASTARHFREWLAAAAAPFAPASYGQMSLSELCGDESL